MCSKLNILPFEVHVEHAGDDQVDADGKRATAVPCRCRPLIVATATADDSGSDTETDATDDGDADCGDNQGQPGDAASAYGSDSDSDSQSSTTASDDESYGSDDDDVSPVDELADYFVRYPQLEVRASEQAPDAGLGVFVRDGCTLEPWDAIPLVGRPLTDAQCAAQVAAGDAQYMVAVPGGVVDGNPAFLPHRGVGLRGAAIWAMVNEPRTTKMNTTFMGGFLVVAKRLRAGDELLVSYGTDYARSYRVSRYVKSTCVRFPRLED